MGKVIALYFVLSGFVSDAQSMDTLHALVQNNIVGYHVSVIANAEMENNGVLKSEFYSGSRIELLLFGHKNQLELSFDKLDDQFYADSNYVLFEVSKNKFFFTDSLSRDLLFTVPYHLFPHDDRYLIAVGKNAEDVLFLSGNCFKTSWQFLVPQVVTEEELKSFLKMRYYAWQIETIYDVKRKRKRWEVMLKLTNGMIYSMQIGRANVDDVSFQLLKDPD